MATRSSNSRGVDGSQAELRGPLVELRAPQAGDEAEFVALRRASRDFLAPWEATPSSHDPFGPERFRRFVRRTANRRRFLVRRRDDGALVGAVSLTDIERERRCATLGFWVGAEHARQGLMGEALGLVLAWSASALRIERVHAYVLPENAASLALLRKCGFVLEAFAPRHRVVAGRLRDHELWTRAFDAAYLPQSRK